jgi:hypothetical protein
MNSLIRSAFRVRWPVSCQLGQGILSGPLLCFFFTPPPRGSKLPLSNAGGDTKTFEVIWPALINKPVNRGSSPFFLHLLLQLTLVIATGLQLCGLLDFGLNQSLHHIASRKPPAVQKHSGHQ